MDEKISCIFSRQFKRMEGELIGLNIPVGFLSIISKYWRFAEEDIQTVVEENGNGLDKNTHW